MSRTGFEPTFRAAALLVSIGLAPPALVAALGGADVELAPGLRVSWFETLPSVAALALAGMAFALPVPSRAVSRWLRVLALVFLASAAAVLWTGGIDSEAFSLRRPGRPTLGAAIWLGLSLWRPGVGARLDLRGAVLAGVLFVVAATSLGLGARGLDRRHFDARLGEPGENPERRPDVVLILADTLRADALGAFGAEPSQTPFLDELAARARRFESTWSQAAWTVPSMVSLFTALHPSTVDAEDGEILRTCGFSGFRLPEVPTLASRLREAGHVTLGFQKNPLLRPGTGFEQGFDHYETVGGDRAEGHAARHMVDAVLRAGARVAERRAEGDRRPLFWYVHLMDPHLDYDPPSAYHPDEPGPGDFDGTAKVVQAAVRRDGGPTPEEVAHMRRLYAGEVRYLDDQLRRLFDGLSEQGLWSDETLFVFLADHGEQFGEHGRFEHCDIHRENLRVPLLIGGAGVVPGTTSKPVRLMDVAPTILDWVGAPGVVAEGRSLRPALEGAALESVPAVSEHKRGYRVTTDRHALLVGKDGERLFDLIEDPGETRDLLEARPEVAERLRQTLAAHRERPRPELAPAPEAEPLDPETREALRALGYLE
ncbi:MAG: sulfatase-like hydrolase/transferase [Myxococcota bacterium]|nr:sulfatase-like hydrolase/transferase [Myxococcota bacterium]